MYDRSHICITLYFHNVLFKFSGNEDKYITNTTGEEPTEEVVPTVF